MSETRTPYRANPAPGGALMTHTALCDLAADYLAVQGAWVLRVHGHLGQRTGVPDILFVLRGIAGGVEVKTGSGRLAPAQKRERDGLIAAGAVYVELRRIEDLELALIEAGLIPRARVI